MPVRLGLVALLAALSLSLSPTAWGTLPDAVIAAVSEITQEELRTHVAYLASDDLAGRGLGQEGNGQAEQYLAGAMRDSGVAPIGGGYTQPFQLYTPALEGEPALRITSGDGTALLDLPHGPDFHPLRASSGAEVSGPLVFAGHGVSAPRVRHDDYRRLNVEGAVVLVLEGAPPGVDRVPGLDDADRAELNSVEHKLAAARQHNAAGLILVRHHMPHPREVWPATLPRVFADYHFHADATVVSAAVSATAAAPVRRALERRTRLTATIRPSVRTAPFTVHNILGMIQGRQPEQGIVVLGAHFDHDGVDEAGTIFNGADDNASGTAAVLAAAGALARAAAGGAQPARTIVFALWNAEEHGLLGAEHFARAPAPHGPVIAKINLDMVGRAEHVPVGDARFTGFTPTRPGSGADTVHLLGYSYSPDMARIVDRANSTGRLKVRTEYDAGAQNLVRRSDHWVFLRRGIPAVFLTTGLHPDYHTPDDDVERIDFGKLERIAELAARAAWMGADGPAPRFRRR